ncbi:hypothetical protein [Methylocella tundrae]|uniref:hypothetical protein n=1 Tax=Methylocella tundrae TaxID=227605 RepID=UPI0030FDFDBC
MEQKAHVAPREEITSADFARNDSEGLCTRPYLHAACEAFWRITDQMPATADGSFGGELSSDDDAEFERFAELLRERRRICHAVAATPANSMESLTTKKEIVYEITREEGASETANRLIASLFADFDRLMGTRSVGQVKRLAKRMEGMDACVAASESDDSHLFSACIGFWQVWESAERLWEEIESIEIGGGQVPIEADGKASECLGALEASIVALTEKEARSVDGIVAKMEVFAISLLFQDCMEGLRLLAASLFDDLDRVIAAYRPDTRTSFCKGVSDRRTVVGKDFLAVGKR